MCSLTPLRERRGRGAFAGLMVSAGSCDAASGPGTAPAPWGASVPGIAKATPEKNALTENRSAIASNSPKHFVMVVLRLLMQGIFEEIALSEYKCTSVFRF
jgi:hypothetical protein